MRRFLISFPARTMVLTDEEFAQAGIDARAVVEEAKAAGVYIWAGGLEPEAPSFLVSADGSAAPTSYPDTEGLNGGVMIIEVETVEAAVEWAAKVATACRCPQELREFYYDPAS